MGIYLFCLSLGFIGLIAIALLGHGHGLGHHGHGRGHSAANAHSGQHGHGGKVHPQSQTGTKWSPWLWLSPRILFSMLFAFGAAGFLLSKWLPAVAVIALAVVAAWAFERWLVQPIWNVLSGFASDPARTLDSALLEEAQAVTNFDRRGHGVVALCLDGQIVQLLAVLSKEQRNLGVRVRAGDQVSVTAVNPLRNSCTVTRLPLPAGPAQASTSN